MKIYNNEQNHSQFKSESEWTLFAFYYGFFLSLQQYESVLFLTKTNDFYQKDIFRICYINIVDSQLSRHNNRCIAEKFGTIITKVKMFEVENGSWIILDAHTKKLLAKDIKSKTEAEHICLKNNYIV